VGVTVWAKETLPNHPIKPNVKIKTAIFFILILLIRFESIWYQINRWVGIPSGPRVSDRRGLGISKR